MSPRGNTMAQWLAWALACAVLLGCQAEQPTTDQAEPPGDQLSGSEILAEVIRQYQAAESYTDQAMLYLNYRIDGRLIQEPQPWSLAWSRNEGLSARLFNAQVQFDGKRISCFVFDIDSANLDGQQWVSRAADPSQIDRLLSDPIGQHFLCGYSELPLSEADKSLDTFLVPPVLRLCSGSQSSGWLAVHDSVQRVADQSLDGIACYVLQLSTPQGSYELYINQQTGVIEQLKLPVAFLDPRVRSADEIEDIQLFARFHEAKLDGSVAADMCQVKRREGAKIVGQFVSIPEAFPSPWIGQPLPDLPLQNPDVTPWSNDELDGKTTALCWFANDVAALPALAQVARQTDQSDRAFFAVYSDADLATPGNAASGLAPAIGQSLPTTPGGPGWLYDPQLSASIQLKLATVPAVLVVGPDRKLQFVQGMGEPDWAERLAAAMQRVAEGEDVAAEMRDEYIKYRQQYDDQLAAHDQSDLFDAAVGVSGSTTAGPRRVTFQRAWKTGGLAAGGNLASRQETLYVLDGFQTIVTLDPNGQQPSRPIPLQLPASHGINRLRAITTGDGQHWFAGFSMLGRTAFLFDENWQTVYQYPPSDTPHDGISDVQLVDTGTKRPELRVAFLGPQGIHQVDTNTGETVVASQQPARSLSVDPASLYVSGDQLRRLADDSIVDQAYQYRSVTGDGRIRIALGKATGNQWQAVSFGPVAEQLWQRPVGQQGFVTDLENVALSPNRDWLAIAAADGRVEILDFAGNPIGQHRFEQPIHGMAWLDSPAGNQLAISFADRVELWQIDPSPVRSVSGELAPSNK